MFCLLEPIKRRRILLPKLYKIFSSVNQKKKLENGDKFQRDNLVSTQEKCRNTQNPKQNLTHEFSTQKKPYFSVFYHKKFLRILNSQKSVISCKIHVTHWTKKKWTFFNLEKRELSCENVSKRTIFTRNFIKKMSRNVLFLRETFLWKCPKTYYFTWNFLMKMSQNVLFPCRTKIQNTFLTEKTYWTQKKLFKSSRTA